MGNVVVVMATPEPMVMDSTLVAACGVGDVESITCTVKLEVPGLAADPVIAPLAAIVRPAGREPDRIDQVNGAAPPEADSVVVYGLEGKPLGRLEVETARAALMVMLTALITDCVVGVVLSVT